MPMLLHTFPYILVDYASNSGALELTVSMALALVPSHQPTLWHDMHTNVGTIALCAVVTNPWHQKWREDVFCGEISFGAIAKSVEPTLSFSTTLANGTLGLLRSRNELEEILAMVEEKRRKLLKFLIIS
ncbi:hypothetical protein Tco_0117691 [Tanacetum coccineum]